MTAEPFESDASSTHRTRAAAPVDVTATSETSWLVSTGDGNMVLGHVTQDGDTYTAYDAQELRIGDFPARDGAIDAITTGTL